MKKMALLGFGVLLTFSCTKTNQESQVLNVSATPCVQTKAGEGRSDRIDVEFTDKGIQITHYGFEVTCDFTTVEVTHTFLNGVLNITQQGTPNNARCKCYTDVSYTIEGIFKNGVNVIFINGIQVYCYNDNEATSIDGIYVGTYTWTNLTRDWSSSSTPTIEFKNGKYNYKGLSNDGYFDRGFGNFTIIGNKIIFGLTFYPIPTEKIGVVDSWLLKGEYEHKIEGNKLIFSKTSIVMADECRYEFELIKNDASIEFSFQYVVGGRLGGNSNLTICADSIHYFGSYREIQSPEVITHHFDMTVQTSKEQWDFLTKAFDLEAFKKIKNGPCGTCVDGTDEIFSVTINGRTYSFVNGNDDVHYKQMQDFFDAIKEVISTFVL
jgi:hypothetical protein